MGVWRADSFDEAQGSDDLWNQALPPTSQFASQISVGEPDVVPVNQAASAWDDWRSEIAALGGVSPLIHFDHDAANHIDLRHGHPGGLARFIAGSPTLLGTLIRDDVQRRRAHQAATKLFTHHTELLHSRGIDSIQLGIGLVQWRHGGETYRGPLLLRPVTLRRRGSDIEFTLQRSGVRLNPALQREFAKHLELQLDAEAFVRLTEDEGAFRPNFALDRLRDLTAHRDDVSVKAQLVVGSFAEVAAPLLSDASQLSHPLLDAIGGNPAAQEEVRQSRAPVEVPDADRRSPDVDRLIVDADTEQDLIVTHILAGNSMTVRTLPGTGSTQTLVNALGALVAHNKRVLVVSPRRATLGAISDRLARTALPGMAARVNDAPRDLIRSIGRNEKATAIDSRDVDRALERVREVIIRYRGALSHNDPQLGVSVLEAIHWLSRLSLQDNPPQTQARLSTEALTRLATGRDDAAQLLREAAELGQFRFGPDDSPWYGVEFSDHDHALRSQQLAKRLASEVLPRLKTMAHQVLEHTALPAPRDFGQLALFVHLLVDIRESLDRFQPGVFDRPLTDLIAATGSNEQASQLTRIQRRRLKALAKEYVRPGMHVGDLHGFLVKINEQRHTWQRFVESGHPPSVPPGLADLQPLLQEAQQDIRTLSETLGREPEQSLAHSSVDQLIELMASLGAESDVLRTLEDRAQVTSTLQDWDLGPLVDDLANRHVSAGDVAHELELAWWRGALEHILSQNQDLLGQDSLLLHRLESDYRLVDEAHASSNAKRLAWQLAERWSVGLMDWPEEAAWLKSALKSGGVTPTNLHEKAPHLSRALAPVWLASPYDVHKLPASQSFDVVVVADAGAVTLAEVAPAIRRGRQVVAMGDPVIQRPEEFDVGLWSDAEEHSSDPEAKHPHSALGVLAEILPGHELTRSYRVTGEDLADLVDRNLYSGHIASLPWAGSFLGHRSVELDIVEDGFGLPDPITGVIESVDAEVRAVVDQVIHHARSQPTQSLMVVTASNRHSQRVYEGVARAVGEHPELSEFFTADGPEPFVSVTLRQAHAMSRDRVIFSLGFGRTPHGRVLSDLGMLSEPGGERLLALGLTRARRHLRVVSCLRPDDLSDPRLQPAVRAVGKVLGEIQNPPALPEVAHESDPMLVDLAERVKKLGLTVSLDHHGVIPLAAHAHGVCIAVDTDRQLLGMSIREGLRLRPQALGRLGWHYVRVHSFELFSDPDGVARKIAAVAGVVAAQEASHPEAGDSEGSTSERPDTHASS